MKRRFQIILNGNKLYKSYCYYGVALRRAEFLALDTSNYVELWYCVKHDDKSISRILVNCWNKL